MKNHALVLGTAAALLVVAGCNQGAKENKTAQTPEAQKAAGTKTIAVANPQVPEVNAIKEELIAFRDAILQNTKTVVSEHDGLMAMDVAHQILQKIGNKVISQG